MYSELYFINTYWPDFSPNILDEIIKRIPGLTSVYYCINTKTNDFMYDLDMELYQHYNPHILVESMQLTEE